jgi:HAD superfamily hydrolase (TIGR01662 family)
VLTALGIDVDDGLLDEWRQRIWSHHSFSLYPTTVETLQKLTDRGYSMAVVSNTINGTTTYGLERAGIQHFFSFVIQSCDVGVRKPNPRIFEIALSRLCVDSEHVLAVGNSPYFDITEPHHMGMHTVLMRTELSYREPSASRVLLTEPDFAVDRLEEILAILGSGA